MKKQFSILALFFISCLFSQTSYYYHNGRKQELQIDRQKINIFVSPTFQQQQLIGLPNYTFVAKKGSNANDHWGTISFSTEISTIAFYQTISQLKSKSGVVGIGYYYKAGAEKSVGTSNLFYVQLKQSTDYAILQEEATKKNVSIQRAVGSDNIWYCLKVGATATGNSVELSNYFFETGKFANVDPGFVFNYTFDAPSAEVLSNTTTTTNCVNDVGFGSQWGLHNPTNTAVDINACAAWQLATGVGTKVAVIDNGIKLDHIDIATNIFPQSYDADSQTQPSQLTPDPDNPGYYSNHGMHVAGIIGAKANNNLYTAGVAHNCNIIAVSSSLTPASEVYNTTENLAWGINWATYNQQADIINCSWFAQEGCESCGFSSALLEYRIINAIENGRNGKGAVVVFAAGNEFGAIAYPAYIDPRIVVVGASTSTGQRLAASNYFTLAPGYENNAVDVMAPGDNINSLLVNSIPNSPNAPIVVDPIGGSSSFFSGTSMAAPHVSGVAALLLEVNPCLTGQEVRDIIEQTAQKVGGYTYATTAGKPNGTWNAEMGYGLLDAHAAVLLAQQLYSGTLDLYIKDNITDLGLEPNNITLSWNSPDIWVRNQDDNIEEHQTPIYNINQPNYVYVRLRNKSCANYSIDEENCAKVELYVSSPSASGGNEATSRTSFNPRENINYTLIDSKCISNIASGEDIIVKFEWFPPLPWVPAGGNLVNANLLAKVVAQADPLTYPETTNISSNAVKNNNIAQKNNISIGYDALGNGSPQKVSIANLSNETKSFSLELIKETGETGKPIYEEAEVHIKMDEVLYEAWLRGGKQEVNTKATLDEKMQLVENNNVLINNIQLNPNEVGFVDLTFNFLAKELTDKTNYKYNIIQRDLATNEIVGGVVFEINKENRAIFEANADDTATDKNEPIVISAKDINEPAIYNWYDSEGNLVFEGKDLQIASAVAEKYKLEVIATTDGFKDYAEVEVTLKPSVLEMISPNPATSNATISYKINEGNSAYLMVIGFYGSNGISNNYMLDVNSTTTNINVSNYPSGFYTVALVVGGEIVDAKTLVKE